MRIGKSIDEERQAGTRTRSETNTMKGEVFAEATIATSMAEVVASVADETLLLIGLRIKLRERALLYLNAIFTSILQFTEVLQADGRKFSFTKFIFIGKQSR